MQLRQKPNRFTMNGSHIMETKIVTKNGVRWAEIRLAVGRQCNIQIFVAKQGWIHKGEYSGESNKPKDKWWSQDVSGYNIRWSQNGSAMMTFEQFERITRAIETAKKLIDMVED